MSYFATRSGSIVFNRPEKEVLLDLREKHPEIGASYNGIGNIIEDYFNIGVEQYDDNSYDFYGNDRYNEDNFIDMLETFAPYVEQPAQIEFRGEDGSLWKLVLKDNKAVDYSGRIIYEDEEEEKND